MGVYRDTRTGRWRYDFTRAGRRWTRKGFPSAVAARRAEQRKRDDLDRGLTDAFPTFRHLVDAWLLQGASVKTAKYLREVQQRMNRRWAHLAELPPRAITRGHIEPTLMTMARTMKAETVNGYRRDVSAILNYGVALGALAYNPCRGIPRIPDDGERRQAIPTEALRTLIAGADPDLRARLIFCAQTGCRWIEMARLKWTELHVGERGAVALLTTRKRRGGHVHRRPQPLTAMALDAIESMRGRDAVYVFPSPRGGHALYVTDKLHLDQLCTRAGVGRWSWHQIRHWVGLQAARAGKNRRAIADLLGQQSVSATDRYIHAAAEEVWLMAGELERALAGGDGDGDGRQNASEGE